MTAKLKRPWRADKREQRSRLELVEPPTARAWLVEPFGSITEPVAFVWTPGSGVAILKDSRDLVRSRQRLEERSVETKMPLVITEGVEGIAATDPYWDGKPTFTCENPLCSKVHDVHQMCAENLFQAWKQPRRRSRSRATM